MDYLFKKVKYRNIFYQRRKWYLVPRVSFLRKLEEVGRHNHLDTLITSSVNYPEQDIVWVSPAGYTVWVSPAGHAIQ